MARAEDLVINVTGLTALQEVVEKGFRSDWHVEAIEAQVVEDTQMRDYFFRHVCRFCGVSVVLISGLCPRCGAPATPGMRLPIPPRSEPCETMML